MLIPAHVPSLGSSSDKTDADLFCAIATHGLGDARGEAAFNCLFNRHRQAVYNFVEQFCVRAGFGWRVAQDITLDAFAELDECAHKFDPKKGAREWLNGIARNECLRYFKEERGSPEYEENIGLTQRLLDQEAQANVQAREAQPETDEAAEQPAAGKSFEEAKREALDQALASLTQRQRTILHACANYYCKPKDDPGEKKPGKQQLWLPDDIAEALCREFKITNDNLRQIISRALNKLRKNPAFRGIYT